MTLDEIALSNLWFALRKAKEELEIALANWERHGQLIQPTGCYPSDEELAPFSQAFYQAAREVQRLEISYDQLSRTIYQQRSRRQSEALASNVPNDH